MTETTIEPTGTYTREQAAKIIATMVLGVKNAESLTCVEAPFDDVPADRWSAGYIAFCVEQGIIDGMTDTTFEPTGTLTGFQWAKMLLAAVGFGANGEFTGTSWSLNTARVAHEAGLFTGDLSGADHVNLSRQQAALYAFNTLTEIKQVTYTSNANNYVYGIGGYWFADGTGRTLGWSVFDLKSATGIIYDNEGNSAKTTVIKNGYYSSNKTLASVNADTDAYMLYHGVRVWYIADGARATTGDAVFVYDMAKVTKLDCPSAKAVSDLVDDYKDIDDAFVVGRDSDKLYEFAAIDNSALDIDKVAGVSYMFDTDTLGVRSNDADSVVVDQKVDNDDVWTDISDIHNGDGIVYMACNDEYYIYATSTTTGNVAKVTKAATSNDVTGFVLTDGTELKLSNLAVADIQNKIAIMVTGPLADDRLSTPAISFTLDSHGHVMNISNEGFKTVAYYTGAYKPETFEDTWNVDVEWIAQFVDVATGEEELVPVTADWKNDVANPEGGYYDITDELNGNSVYEPYKVGPAAYGAYRFTGVKDVVEFTSKSIKLEVYNNDYLYYNPDTVVFYIAKDNGKDLVVNDYVGVDALIAAYDSEEHPIDTVTLTNVAVLTADSMDGGKYASVIFAYDGANTVLGGTVFFPNDLNKNNWTSVTDNYYEFSGVYLNGQKDATTFAVSKTVFDSDYPQVTVTRGFYRYELDAETKAVVSFERIPVQGSLTATKGDLHEADGYITLKDIKVTDDCVVVDVRDIPASEKVDDVNELALLLKHDYADSSKGLDLVYFKNSDGDVAVIYVVASNSYTFKVQPYTGSVMAGVTKFGLAKDNSTLSCSFEGSTGVWSAPNTVKVTCTTSDVDKHDFSTVNLVVWDGTTNYEIPASKITVDGGTFSFEWTVDSNETLSIVGYCAPGVVVAE